MRAYVHTFVKWSMGYAFISAYVRTSIFINFNYITKSLESYDVSEQYVWITVQEFVSSPVKYPNEITIPGKLKTTLSTCFGCA